VSLRPLLTTAGALALVVSLAGCGALYGTYTLLTATDAGPEPDGGDPEPDVDAGEYDAGQVPCPEGCGVNETCYVDDDGDGTCVPRCVDSFTYADPVGYVTSDCAEVSQPCVYADGDFLCRDGPQVTVNCGATPPGCYLDNTVLFVRCSSNDHPIFFECHDRCVDEGNPRCVTDDVPAGWTCDPVYYGAADGCDCGCGIQDPDCVDATVDSCVWCTGCALNNEECACSWPNGDCAQPVEPGDNSACVN
jgi:hypothetical protein